MKTKEGDTEVEEQYEQQVVPVTWAMNFWTQIHRWRNAQLYWRIQIEWEDEYEEDELDPSKFFTSTTAIYN
ncbi:hypothetical protein KY289_033841 [Solanum tuberosum]|nr:hypothetical protein KY289_033841 [Solanum tuberosum]